MLLFVKYFYHSELFNYASNQIILLLQVCNLGVNFKETYENVMSGFEIWSYCSFSFYHLTYPKVLITNMNHFTK